MKNKSPENRGFYFYNSELTDQFKAYRLDLAAV